MRLNRLCWTCQQTELRLRIPFNFIVMKGRAIRWGWGEKKWIFNRFHSHTRVLRTNLHKPCVKLSKVRVGGRGVGVIGMIFSLWLTILSCQLLSLLLSSSAYMRRLSRCLTPTLSFSASGSVVLTPSAFFLCRSHRCSLSFV